MISATLSQHTIVMSEMDIDPWPSAGPHGEQTVEAGQSDGMLDGDDFDDIPDSAWMESEANPAPIEVKNNPFRMPAPAKALIYQNTNADDLVGDMPRQLMLFYRHFFPMKPYYDWLNYNKTPVPSKTFMNREFCFTLIDETYIRFQSYRNVDEFKQELVRLCPAKIDLGAIYNIKPKDKNMIKASSFQPVSKELVFDIDMTDYDEIRTCCSGGEVCSKCWEFMTVAMKIINAALVDDFGFKHLLWVYSGRRGIHCWIADERARLLNNEQRKSIVSYLEVVKGGAQQGKKVKLPNVMHPSLSRSYETVNEHFRDLVLGSQDILAKPEHWEKVLAIIPDEEVQAQVRAAWEETPGRASEQKWDDLVAIFRDAKAASPKKHQHLDLIIRDIKFQLTYPRLDDKVTTDMKHLLKSPFCVHPKTGRVCVPIPMESCESFDPSSPPTVPQLVRELNEYDATHKDGSKLKDWQKTSLREHVEVFKRFVEGIQEDIKREPKQGDDLAF
ncbi:hypothetical protein KVV02_006370 [Mortierella alpina]|uniref:DNA primase n=1 Tax=Mortierella alpina TaxID=64518 RepID=A0A9P8D393_MORAP|nr:hypothetical protein KVV02_006370 [Mortierella alpina]